MRRRKRFPVYIYRYLCGLPKVYYQKARQAGRVLDGMTVFHLVAGLGGQYLFRYRCGKRIQEYYKFTHDELYRSFRDANLITEVVIDFYQSILRCGISKVQQDMPSYAFERYIRDLVEDICDIQAFIAYFKYTPDILTTYPWLSERVAELEERLNKHIKPVFLRPPIIGMYGLYRLSKEYQKLYAAKRPNVTVFPLDELAGYHRVTISEN